MATGIISIPVNVNIINPRPAAMAKTTIRGSSVARLSIQLAMAAAAIWWLLYWFFRPINKTHAWLRSIDDDTKSTFLGTRGSLFLLQVLPMIVIAFLSFFLLELRRRLLKPTAKEPTEGRKPRIEPWNFPVFIKSPFFGMLTVGDLVFILVVLFINFWYFINDSVKYSQEIDDYPTAEGDPPKWVSKMGSVGVLFGDVSVIPIALLWLPVSRGSAILQVVGVPYERAVKYHTWLGYLTVWFVIFHGALLTGYYIHEHETKELITWYAEGQGISVAAGVVALVAGVIMMLTAVEVVRRRFFDLFFVSHHLYLVFLIFFGFHVVDRMMYIIVPLLLFFLDRFMRAVQSRKAVDVLSAKVYKSGLIELKFAKAATSTYHALSFVYVLLPSVSRLHWHPFSVASSPLDGTNEIAIYIKPLGGFTKNLHDALISSHVQNSKPGRAFYKCPFSCKVGVEGPYGDESAFYLKYKRLVLVAGGIGVTPFVAIIRDILHRYRLQQEDLPSSVHLLMCTRNVAELHILDAIAPSSVLPGYEERLTITMEAYVTTKSASADANTANLPSTETSSSAPGELMSCINFHESIAEVSMQSSEKSVREMSPISSTGHSMWVCAAMCSTLVGFFVINGIFNVTELKSEDALTNYDRVFMLTAAVTIPVVVFGGGVMLVWSLFEKRARTFDSRVTSRAYSTTHSPVHHEKNSEKNKDIETSIPTDNLWQGNITYGRRPSWKGEARPYLRLHSQTVIVLRQLGDYT